MDLVDDLWGACSPSDDHVPDRSELRPPAQLGANMWVFGETGAIALPRFGVEALASQWEHAGLQANVVVPGKFVLNGAGSVNDFAVADVDDVGRQITAGPLRLVRRESLHHWTACWAGTMRLTDARSQRLGLPAKQDTDVAFELSADMATPPWFQDPTLVGASGGRRLTQFFRSSGSLTVAGVTYPLDGTGLRVLRTGTRPQGTFNGHVWQGALFPSGAAFELLDYRTAPGGPPKFSGAFILRDGRRTDALVREVRWLSADSDDDVSIILEVDGREVGITGMVHGETFSPAGGSLFLGWRVKGKQPTNRTHFQQAMVRYEWDGEVSYGLLERSCLRQRAGQEHV